MNPDSILNFKQLLSTVRCFVFDIDGVLTNGSLLIQSDGSMLRSMNIKDGYALRLAAKKHYQVFIISGSHQPGSAIRLNRLGIEEVHHGVEQKLPLLENLLLKTKTNFSEVLYMGDDMPDLEVMEKCGVRTCPADAVHQIKSISQYISGFKGGEGCVRDVIEQVLTLNGHWE
jgi:3-deoxy-D-manno-octulosonate 8-phosphate phosphatase (KDO 8-P phosphatase)